MPEGKINIVPKVSVVVPARNAAASIARLLESLLDLDYPKEALEIIVVDNGSSDNTAGIVAGYPVLLLRETGVISSYAARNRGIAAAGGELIAFTDADCAADSKWLKNAVEALVSGNSDMVAGQVKVIRSVRPGTAQLFSSFIGLDNKYYVSRMRGAITANLVVKREMFARAGYFRPLISGEDLGWTQRAVNKGYLLIYSAEALVLHPARGFKELLRQNYRVGRGFINARADMKGGFLEKARYFAGLFFPANSLYILKKMQEERLTGTRGMVLGLFLVDYLCKACQAAGIFRSFLGPYVRAKK